MKQPLPRVYLLGDYSPYRVSPSNCSKMSETLWSLLSWAANVELIEDRSGHHRDSPSLMRSERVRIMPLNQHSRKYVPYDVRLNGSALRKGMQSYMHG